MAGNERPLDQLNQRELLILINVKVEQLEEKMDAKNNNDIKTMLEINTLKVQLRERSIVWGSIASIFVTIVIQVVIYLLKHP